MTHEDKVLVNAAKLARRAIRDLEENKPDDAKFILECLLIVVDPWDRTK